MPSKKPYIQIRTTETIIKKFDRIADENNRSMSNMGETIIKDYIKNYEAEHGEIKIDTPAQDEQK